MIDHYYILRGTVTLNPKAMSFNTVSSRNINVNTMFMMARMSASNGGASWYYKTTGKCSQHYKLKVMPTFRYKTHHLHVKKERPIPSDSLIVS